ncbi:hypothetical protein MBLNU230_g7060t1 [Neophaeotheca triangularis]
MAARPREARRSKRQATTRKRSLYQEVDTDDELEADSEDDFQPASRRERFQDSPQPPLKKQRTTKRVAKPQTRSVAAKTKSKPARRAAIGAPRRARKTPSEAADAQRKFTGPSDGRIPPWATLPVNIQRDIFVFASQPLHERGSEHNVAWLMQTARGVCRAFAQPALEAYYESPAFLNTTHPHDLAALLRLPKENRFMDYNVKIRKIEMGVQYLAYTAHSRALFHLCSLVSAIPRLQHLEIKHPVHEPPYRPVKFQKWQYPRDLHHVLSHRGVRLKSWRWSREMINISWMDDGEDQSDWSLQATNGKVFNIWPTRLEGSDDLYSIMTRVHLTDAFQSLERVTICGFNQADSVPKAETEEEKEQNSPVQDLQSTLSALPHLRDLTFISCDLLRDNFFETLPTRLQRLELSNCRYVNSEMLSEFLAFGGSQLLELELKHNIALDLAFLPALNTSCPKLERLKVDAHFYSELVTVYDADPLYDELLLPDEIPSWPASLQSIELLQLQKWSMEAAVNLFKSLIDSAPNLPALRHLAIEAHVNMPWRDRAGFRDQWIERLRRVYLHKPEPPLAMLGSLRQWKLWNLMNKAQGPAKSNNASSSTAGASFAGKNDSDNEPLARRKMTSVSISPRKPHNGDTDVYSDDSDAPLRTSRRPRRSTRVQTVTSTKTSTPATTSDDSEAADDVDVKEDWRTKPEASIQGLCHTVDVRIDNQRPRETQRTEAEFLDSEVSGDEDWTENGVEGVEEEEEDRYAW